MPSNKVTIDSYNDGILFYGEVKSKLDNQARKIGEEFVLKGKLFYDEMSKRDQDLEVANSLEKTLDYKVKTPRIDLDSTYKVKIKEEYYDIIYIDSDEKNNYIYLTKVIL